MDRGCTGRRKWRDCSWFGVVVEGGDIGCKDERGEGETRMSVRCVTSGGMRGVRTNFLAAERISEISYREYGLAWFQLRSITRRYGARLEVKGVGMGGMGEGSSQTRNIARKSSRRAERNGKPSVKLPARPYSRVHTTATKPHFVQIANGTQARSESGAKAKVSATRRSVFDTRRRFSPL